MQELLDWLRETWERLSRRLQQPSVRTLEVVRSGETGGTPQTAGPTNNTNNDPLDWDDERWEAVLDNWADRILRYGMETPAVFLGESQKPLSFIFGQAVYFLEPFLDSASFLHPALRGESVEVLGALLSDRRRLEQLLVKIEERARRQPPGRNQPMQ